MPDIPIAQWCRALPSRRLRAAIAARFEERIELCGIGGALQTIEKRAELGRFVLELSQRCATVVVEGRVAETTQASGFRSDHTIAAGTPSAGRACRRIRQGREERRAASETGRQRTPAPPSTETA